ncbi:MAG: DUF3443 family protein [Gallionella sp.]
MVMASVLMASCGGGGSIAQLGSTSTFSAGIAPGSPIPPPPTNGSATTVNTFPIVVDAGPVPTVIQQINVAYVSVTVCAPGTSPATAACQTIDHVMVDTGSSGLRLLKSVLYSSLNLPQVTSGGSAIGECQPFAIGTTWGSVRSADIYLGGEVARSATFQDIGDTPGGVTFVPRDCSATGAIQGDTGNLQTDQTALGANGILGVGLFPNDCAPCLIQIPNEYVPAAYYTCNTVSGCTNSQVVTTAQIVQNPVAILSANPASLSLDNNGVLIDFTNPNGTHIGNGTAGYTSLTGSLILGIGTEANNQPTLTTTQNEYDADAYGNLLTSYTISSGSTVVTGTVVPMVGVLDSGSNALFFPDLNITQCTPPPAPPSWYCPSSPLSLIAANQSVSNGYVPMNFTLVGLQLLANNTVGLNIGAYSYLQPELNSGLLSSTYPLFDWGLPFFYNQPVFTGIAGMTAPTGVSAAGAAGGYWIY